MKRSPDYSGLSDDVLVLVIRDHFQRKHRNEPALLRDVLDGIESVRSDLSAGIDVGGDLFAYGLAIGRDDPAAVNDIMSRLAQRERPRAQAIPSSSDADVRRRFAAYKRDHNGSDHGVIAHLARDVYKCDPKIVSKKLKALGIRSGRNGGGR
jgi:hypothetical protein